MGPSESENVKTLLLLQIAAKGFETCPEFSSQWSSQNYLGFETCPEFSCQWSSQN